MSGIIYFIQPATLVGSIPSRYKIGMSSKNNLKRCNSYGDGSRFICIMESNNPNFVENKLKEEFNKKFKLCAGNEYFEGNETEMLYSFLEIMNKYNNVGFIDKDAEYKMNVYEKDEIVSDLILINKTDDEKDDLKYVILKDLFEYLCNVYNKNIKMFEYEICNHVIIDDEVVYEDIFSPAKYKKCKIIIKKKINCDDDILKYQKEIDNMFDEFIFNIKNKYTHEFKMMKYSDIVINNINMYFASNKKNIISSININYCNDDKINNILKDRNDTHYYHKYYKEINNIIMDPLFNIDDLNNIFCNQYKIINNLYSLHHNIDEDMITISLCYFLGYYDVKYSFITSKYINNYIDELNKKYDFILLKEIDSKYSGIIVSKGCPMTIYYISDTEIVKNFYYWNDNCDGYNHCEYINTTFESFYLHTYEYSINSSIYSYYSNKNISYSGESNDYMIKKIISENIIRKYVKTKILNDDIKKFSKLINEHILLMKDINNYCLKNIDNILKKYKNNIKYKTLILFLKKIKKYYKDTFAIII